MPKSARLLLVLPALLVASCSLFSEDDVSEVALHQGLWERLGYDTYEYDLAVWCFCKPAVGLVRIHVRADTVHTATVLETGAPLEAHQLWRAKTIDELFDIVLDADENADELDITYDDTFHYPSSVWIDYLKEAVDEEIRYEAENFRPLRGP